MIDRDFPTAAEQADRLNPDHEDLIGEIESEQEYQTADSVSYHDSIEQEDAEQGFDDF
jgi:hypothetical protein